MNKTGGIGIKGCAHCFQSPPLPSTTTLCPVVAAVFLADLWLPPFVLSDCEVLNHRVLHCRCPPFFFLILLLLVLSLSVCLVLHLLLSGCLSISLCLCSPFEMQWEREEHFPRIGKGTQRSGRGKGIRVGLGAEVTVATAPDNTTTRKCQIWGFFLLSVPWFGLCCFSPQSILVVFRGPGYRGEN